MTRYIDADALKEQMFNYYDCVNEGTCKGGYSGQTLMDYEVADMIHDCIDDAPTADVVEVVRCKDCKHYAHAGGYAVFYGKVDKNNPYVCRKWGDYATCDPDGFCNRGERRSNESKKETRCD